MVANDLLVTTTNKWFDVVSIVVDLTQGSVINVLPTSGGIDKAPILNLPAFDFDTYIGRIGATTEPMGGAVELGWGRFLICCGPSSISASWYEKKLNRAYLECQRRPLAFSVMMRKAPGRWRA